MHIGTSTAFNEKVLELSRTFHAKIECGSVVIDSGFRNVTIHYQAHADEETISIGDAVATYVTIEMYKPDFTFTGKKFTLFLGLELDNGTIEHVQVGKFTAQKPENDRGVITFTAYDSMTTTLGHPYFSSLTGEPDSFSGLTSATDAKNVLQEIIDLSGITFIGMDNLPAGKEITLQSYGLNADETKFETHKTFDGSNTYREVIGYIAGIYGKFATINANGELEFRWYKETGYTISNTRNLDDTVCSETEFKVQYINALIAEGNTLTAGSGETGISVYNPLMPDVESIADDIIGFSYYPLTMSILGDPRIEIGDIVKIEQDDGTLLNIPVMSLTQDYDGGLTSIVGCYGNTAEADVAASSVTTTSSEIETIKQQILKVQEVNATTVTTEYLNANYATIQSLTAVTADITDLKSNTITTAYLEANYAHIDLANIDKANVGILLADVGLITDAKIENGHVTGYLDSVAINAATIKAGTLSVDRLVINGNNESLVYAMNNSGELASTHCDTLDGGLITERTIVADHLVAGTITSNEINTSQLFSSSGFISALSATSIIVTTKQTAEDAASVAAQAKSTANSASSTASSAISTANSAASAAAEANGTLADWAYNNNLTYIDGGNIYAGTVTAAKIATDAIKSRNYVAGSTGSFLNLTDGSFSSNYLSWNSSGSLRAKNITVVDYIYGCYTTSSGDTAKTKVIACTSESKAAGYICQNGTLSRLSTTSSSTISSLQIGCNAFQTIFDADTNEFRGGVAFVKGLLTSTIRALGGANFHSSVYFAGGTDYYISASGGARVSALTCKGAAAVNSLSVTTTTTLSSTLTVASTAKFSGAVYFAGGTTYYLSTNGNINANHITAAGTATFNGAATFNSNVTFENRPKCVDSYTTTYTTAANMVVTSNGYFGRYSSSSRRYKHDIRPLNIADVRCLYDVPLHTFRYNEGYISPDDERYDKDIPGLIAEELDAVLPIAVDHIKVNGIFQAEMPNTYTLLQCTLALVQDLNNRTSFLEDNMVTNLQAQCNDLQSRLAAAELQIEQLKQAVA